MSVVSVIAPLIARGERYRILLPLPLSRYRRYRCRVRRSEATPRARGRGFKATHQVVTRAAGRARQRPLNAGPLTLPGAPPHCVPHGEAKRQIGEMTALDG